MFIEKLAEIWSVNDEDELPPCADLIVPASFGATRNRLTNGAQITLDKVLELAERYPDARVAFGVFTFSPVPNLEEMIKRQFLKDPIFVGDVASTIEEAEKHRDSMPCGFTPRTIILVTDEWHSRSMKRVWKWVWRNIIPRPDIRMVVVSSLGTIDEDSPMKNGRTYAKWVQTNVSREAFLVFPGSIRLMKKLKLRQPTS